MSKTVLITGVAGFIGSNLASRLIEAGYRVVGIDNLSAGTRENVPLGVEFYKKDILDPEIYPLFAGVDTVFHLAAKNCLPDCAAHPIETVQINNVGTMNVLEAIPPRSTRESTHFQPGKRTCRQSACTRPASTAPPRYATATRRSTTWT